MYQLETSKSAPSAAAADISASSTQPSTACLVPTWNLNNNDPLANIPVPDIELSYGKGLSIYQGLNISYVDCLSRLAAVAASDSVG